MTYITQENHMGKAHEPEYPDPKTVEAVVEKHMRAALKAIEAELESLGPKLGHGPFDIVKVVRGNRVVTSGDRAAAIAEASLAVTENFSSTYDRACKGELEE